MSGRQPYGTFAEPKVHDGPVVRLPTALWASLVVIIVGLVIVGGFAIAAFAVSVNHSDDGEDYETLLAPILSSVETISDYIFGITEGSGIASTSSVDDVDTLVIGGGPGGLVFAYRACKSLRSELMIVNDRDYWGGKVYSFKSPASSNANPLYTPTCAEQYRGGDAIFRCLAQELGKPSQNRPGPISHFEAVQRSTNATTVDCYTPTETITGPPSCDAGSATDRYGPNGDLPIYPNAPDYCDGSDWKSCSNVNAYFDVILDPANVDTIRSGESFYDYVVRLLGESGADLFRQQSGYNFVMDAPSDALQAVNYINYDFNYDYSTLPVTVGGSQQVLLSMVDRIRANNTRMQLNTKIVAVSSLRRATRGYRYLATTSRGDSIRAKRIVFAIPPGALKQMSGDIVERLKRSKFVSTLWQNRACTWNVFFPTNWWQRLHTSCNTGYCTTLFADGAFTLDSNTRARNYATWSAAGQHDIPFLQYVGTDERQAGKLLRIYLEEEECEPLARDLEVGGQGAVKDTMMARLRRAFPLDTIPNPTGFFYRDEEFAYSLPGIGADYTNDQLLSWASRPLDREGVCMASEGYNFFDGGWQEAAAVSAHRCLGGPVFSDIFHPADIAKFERCTNVFTGRVLDKADPQYDQCLLLANEASMRDLAGLDFCGGPSTQAIVSEGNDTISVSSASSDWEGAATERVPPDTNGRRVHRYSAL